MLVLSRKVDETLVFTTPEGRRIEVMLVEIRTGKYVRLGVKADRDVHIIRGELEGKPPQEPKE